MSSDGERRNKRPLSEAVFSPSDDSDYEVIVSKRKRSNVENVDSDSDSFEPIARKRMIRSRLMRMSSSSSSSDDSSDNELIGIIRRKKTNRLSSSEDDSSEWEDESAIKENAEDSSSDSNSDGQSEKCPICILRFKNQEIGTPASCEHSFCVGCILEWSKSVNTCPVDRIKFNQIRVRKCYTNSDYFKTIPVAEPTNSILDEFEDVVDLTACEVCGSTMEEDRLLLCDNCDSAYHLQCLTPPLEEVPQGNWFCEHCSRPDAEAINFDPVLFDFVVSTSAISRRNLSTSRLIPRTRQSERIRTRIVYQRRQHQEAFEIDSPSDTVNVNQPGPSTSASRPATIRRKTTRRKRRKKKKTKIAKYKITYELNEATGEKIAVKKLKRKYTRRKKRTRKSKIKFKRFMVGKTAKERLAQQLGLYPPSKPGQMVPNVKAVPSATSAGGISTQRSRAGIASLQLFGQRDELNYFSESDSEGDGGEGVNILVARRPNRSDVSVFRRAARNKAAAAAAMAPTVTQAVDLLGSILNSQAAFHSKNAAISLKSDGTVKIDVNKNIHKDTREPNNRRVDLGSADSLVHQRPMAPNTSGAEGGSCDANVSNSGSCDTEVSNNTVPTSTVEFSNTEALSSAGKGGDDDNEEVQDYSPNRDLDELEAPKDQQKKKEDEEENEVPKDSPTNSASELDIYSDIETVSTSKIVDEPEVKCPSPPPPPTFLSNLYDDNESETDLVIDTEKAESDKYDPTSLYESDSETTKEEETVTSTSEPPVNITKRNDFTSPTSSSEIQSETVQSTNQNEYYNSRSFADEEDKVAECDNEEPTDDCPNFSIYSAESINLAKNSELNMMMAQNESAKVEEAVQDVGESSENVVVEKISTSKSSGPFTGGLYSDSEDESLIKFNKDQPFGICDIRNMTEDISDEERSYTPCLDEKEPGSLKEGLAGLDTEMISDDDKNDFEETQEMKMASDGDALEINAKESELDFTRPDECEEGEIVDKLKNKTEGEEEEEEEEEVLPKEPVESEAKEETKNDEGENKDPVFKKLSKSNKERNYRDKENKERSKSKDKKDGKNKENKENREREIRANMKREVQRKEKRREIARYNVRSLVETKPKKPKRDKFGRDLQGRARRSNSNARKRTPSTSRTPSLGLKTAASRRSQSLSSDSSSSRRYGAKGMRRKSYSTSRSRSPISRGRKSHSPDRRKRRRRSLSRSKSRGRKRSRSRLRKRVRSSSRNRVKGRKRSGDKGIDKMKRKRKRQSHSRSPSRRREWGGRHHSREWTPSLSRSRSPEPRHFTPSWTPPRMMNQGVRPQNLTVILPNDTNKKKKDKKRKQEKKNKEGGGASEKQKKRRRSERSPLPSKEVFASGDNILVSVSFNKDNEVRTERVRRKRDSNASEELSTRRVRKENQTKSPAKRKRVKLVTNIKPVAIIDLDRSPFKELTPSPKDIIVLSDSENGDSNDLLGLQNALHQQSPQQAASPEVANNSNYMNSMGPKTPPEPQVKFTFSSKQPQLRSISNPLRDPDDDQEEEEIDPQEELENRLNEVAHKGPNTPPEPPNSPPSSPDAYDPFDPTKSRTPSPEPNKQANAQSSISQIIEDSQEEMGDISASIDLTKKSSPVQTSKSHTPPISIADIQPADSQSSVRAITPDTNQGSSPERSISVVINQVPQSQSSLFPSSTPITYSTSSTALITSTPISSSLAVPRINILNSTILTPPVVTSSISQRITLPNTTKTSPVNKVSPAKTSSKPQPSKGNSKAAPAASKNSNWKNKNRSNENNDTTNLDMDSPYSPGSSDYEDLFEPPAESTKIIPSATKLNASAAPATKNNNNSSGKNANAFDTLFGSSPIYNNNNKKQPKTKAVKTKKSSHHKGQKQQVGVKLDEDNLKILDDLPNSAVEMQVKDKFLKKLNRQERVVEEVKFVLKPYYNKKRITKEEYKDILRRSVPKICHNKSGEINPQKIQQLIEAYVKKSKHNKKVTSSSSTVNPQKTEVVSKWLSKLN